MIVDKKIHHSLNMDCVEDQSFGSKVNVQGEPDLCARLSEDKVAKILYEETYTSNYC